MPPTDGDDRFTPPTPTQVARRSLTLSAVACRGFLELKADSAESAAVTGQITDWLTQLDLHGAIEPQEAAILRYPLGRLERQAAVNSSWVIEGLAVLAWALGRYHFPKHDEQVDPYAVTDALDFLGDEAANLLRLPELRTAPELQACRELLYDVHCRLRGYLREASRKDITAWIDKEWLDLLHLDADRLIMDGDLAVAGKPIFRADKQSVQACEHIIRERHRAAIWLIGEYPLYSELPVDT
jgi:hypothetical protein